MQELPLISVIHPTRRVSPSEGFPRGWRDAHDAYLAACDHPENVEYILVVHESRWDEFWTSGLCGVEVQWSGWSHFRVVINHKRDCVVDQINAGAKESTGKLLTGTMDDLYPSEHWDSKLLSTNVLTHEHNLDRECVILCSSGASPERDRELMICGASTRKVYERRGYILDPAFESMFADNWWAFENRRDEAAGLLQIIERLDIQFDHRHPVNQLEPAEAWNKVQSDPTYKAQNSPRAYNQGIATFRNKVEGTRVISVLMPGRDFPFRWVFAMFEVMDRLTHSNFIVQRFGSHTSNVYGVRIQIAQAVLNQLQDSDLNVVADSDLVLWVDSDNVVTPDNVSMLIADLDAHPELDWVGGWCWCDTGDYDDIPFRMSCGRQGARLECNWFTLQDYLKLKQSGQIVIKSDDVAPDALWTGFPVVLMRGAMLKTLGWEAFRPMLGDYHLGFTSEDTTFFYQAHQKGLKGAIDMRVKVPHLKLRAIEPQILPMEEREQVLEYLKSVEQTLGPEITASTAD